MANEKRLIDANELRLEIIFQRNCLATDKAGEWTKGYRSGLESLFSTIEDQPTVDAVEVVHGRWILEQVYKDGTADYKCSICDFDDAFPIGNFTYRNYCSNCGAKMDGDENEID